MVGPITKPPAAPEGEGLDTFRLGVLSDVYARTENTLSWQSGKYFVGDGFTKALCADKHSVFQHRN